MRLRFTRAITIEGTAYESGQVVESTAIPAGAMESLNRFQAVVEHTEESVPTSEPQPEINADPAPVQPQHHNKKK